MSNQSPSKKKLSLEDFVVKHILGKGAYGDVFLVIKDNQKYALKQIVKKKLSRQHKQYQALVEKEILRCMKHPGIITLKFAFQDKAKLYFVLQYCQGGQFIKFIKQNVQFLSQALRRFYVAQIVNLLEYLHKNGITHRDLKPQNLLLSGYGHLKLIDFGTSQISQCKILSQQFKQNIEAEKKKQPLEEGQNSAEDQQGQSPRKRRSTFVGTCYYLSPELLQQNICEPPSDLWALGCIIYQLYYLQTPFKDSHQYAIFQKIKKAKVQFPKNQLISEDAIDLIKKLLVKNPYERLGSCSNQQLSFQKLKSHPYFKNINVDQIFNTPPPDLNIQKFTMSSKQLKLQKIKQFQLKIQQILKQKEEQQKSQIIYEAIVQRRMFPYYENFHMRIHENGEIQWISQTDLSIQIQQLDLTQETRANLNQQGQVIINIKKKVRQVLRMQNSKLLIQKINSIKLSQQINSKE